MNIVWAKPPYSAHCHYVASLYNGYHYTETTRQRTLSIGVLLDKEEKQKFPMIRRNLSDNPMNIDKNRSCSRALLMRRDFWLTWGFWIPKLLSPPNLLSSSLSFHHKLNTWYISSKQLWISHSLAILARTYSRRKM